VFTAFASSLPFMRVQAAEPVPPYSGLVAALIISIAWRK
jgi:hypothetical protein